MARGSGEFVGDEEVADIKIYQAQLIFFLEVAQRLGYSDMVQDFKGALMPSEDLFHEEDEIVKYYSDYTFWEELELRLGQRGFLRETSKEELKNPKKDRCFSDSIYKYCKKYRKEFEKNGIDRLDIKRPKK